MLQYVGVVYVLCVKISDSPVKIGVKSILRGVERVHLSRVVCRFFRLSDLAWAVVGRWGPYSVGVSSVAVCRSGICVMRQNLGFAGRNRVKKHFSGPRPRADMGRNGPKYQVPTEMALVDPDDVL